MKIIFIIIIFLVTQSVHGQKFDSTYKINKTFALVSCKDTTFIQYSLDSTNKFINELQSKIWFVHGDLFSREQCFLTEKTSKRQTPELAFLRPFMPGYLELRYDKKNKFTCEYEIIKDMLRFHYRYDKCTYVHCFKIKKSTKEQDLVLSPINADEFK